MIGTIKTSIGFLLGILAHGLDLHISQLHQLLVSDQFQAHEESFMELTFDFYIRPFHKCYNDDSEGCHTPTFFSTSESDSADDLNSAAGGKELTHENMKRGLIKRDGVCLFCRDTLESEAAHIIAN